MKAARSLTPEPVPVIRSQSSRLRALLAPLHMRLASLQDPSWQGPEGPLLLCGVLLCAANVTPALPRGARHLGTGLRHLLNTLDSSPLTRSIQVLQEALEAEGSEIFLAALEHLQSTVMRHGARAGQPPTRAERLLAQGEALLAALTPKVRAQHGVYFTPSLLVDSAIQQLRAGGALPRSCQALIEQGEGLPEVLDPACGGGAFLLGVLSSYHRSSLHEADGDAQPTLWTHSARLLLTRLRGLELLPFCQLLAYVVLHVFLVDTGLQPTALPRPRITLADTLAMPPDALPAVRVILGNPPWRRLSASRARVSWEERLRQVDGQPLSERKHWLTDDYVRFFAWSLAVLEQKQTSALAFVTNNGYLTGQTLRGLRSWLWLRFSSGQIWDGGGGIRRGGDAASLNKLLKVQQGLCLGLFFSRSRASDHGPDGSSPDSERCWRYSPLDALLDPPAQSAPDATPLTPTAPLYRFAPDPLTPAELAERSREWERFVPLTALLPIHSSGILTARDHLCVSEDRAILLERIRRLRDPQHDTTRLQAALNVRDTRTWSLGQARAALQASSLDDEALCVRILYRPFQPAWLLYHRAFTWRLRAPVMDPLRHRGNLALVTTRMTQGEPFTHAILTDCPVEVISLSPHTSSNAFVFPLWIGTPDALQINVDPASAAVLGFEGAVPGREHASVDTPLSPDVLQNGRRLFYYLYGILWSSAWRMRYSVCLRDDFPRIPLISSPALRADVCQVGEALASLHQTMTPPQRSPRLCLEGLCLEGEETAVVPTLAPRLKPLEPDGEVGTIALTESAVLTNVSTRAWKVKVGAYSVLEQRLRMLKAQRRALTPECLEALSDLHALLDRTAALVLTLDAAIERGGGFPAVSSSVDVDRYHGSVTRI